jgi:hypothetical protein
MGGSGIRSAVGVVVGLCSRWEAGNLLQRACGAIGLGIIRWGGGEVEILYGPGITAGSCRFPYRKPGGLVTSIGP